LLLVSESGEWIRRILQPLVWKEQSYVIGESVQNVIVDKPVTIFGCFFCQSQTIVSKSMTQFVKLPLIRQRIPGAARTVRVVFTVLQSCRIGFILKRRHLTEDYVIKLLGKTVFENSFGTTEVDLRKKLCSNSIDDNLSE